MKNKCYSCLENLSYSERWDAYFCKDCNLWSEKACNDPLCFFCDGRPERPIKNHHNPKHPDVVYGNSTASSTA